MSLTKNAEMSKKKMHVNQEKTKLVHSLVSAMSKNWLLDYWMLGNGELRLAKELQAETIVRGLDPLLRIIGCILQIPSN